MIEIYNYIRICLLYHKRDYLNKPFYLKDYQHDIFLHIQQKKGSDLVLNSQIKKYIFILCKYYPIYLNKHYYSRQKECVILDSENNPIEQGVSYSEHGDTNYDHNVYLQHSKKKVKQVYREWNVKQVQVTYHNRVEIFKSMAEAADKLELSRSTFNKWIAEGIPTQRRVAKDVINISIID